MNIILFEREENKIPLNDERARHILNVLSLNEGDSFSFGIINGEKGKATILKIDQNGIQLSFSFSREKQKVAPIDLIISQIRPICMKRVLRDITTLGVRRIILTTTELGEKSYEKSSFYTTNEYFSYILDGAMQSGQTNIPQVEFAHSVKEGVEKTSGISFLFDNVIGKENFSENKIKLKNKSVTIAIGGERGFTDKEREIFLKRNFIPVLMGERILRSETAAITAVALTLSKMGLL